MYNNLEAEMVRFGVTRKDIAKLLQVRYATVIDKLKGRYSFTLDEAFAIRDKFFPHLQIEYLFKKEEKTAWLQSTQDKTYAYYGIRGDDSMAVVKKYKLGNTVIRIHDDAYKDKTKEDIDRILERISEIATNSYIKKLKKGELKKWIT